MTVDILVCFLLQIAFTVGIIFLFGCLIALCNGRFYANFGDINRAFMPPTEFSPKDAEKFAGAICPFPFLSDWHKKAEVRDLISDFFYVVFLHVNRLSVLLLIII